MLSATGVQLDPPSRAAHALAPRTFVGSPDRGIPRRAGEPRQRGGDTLAILTRPPVPPRSNSRAPAGFNQPNGNGPRLWITGSEISQSAR